mmetsp:Transcript_5678/g.7609  ORF Transcript_5678/g.7609 Transcript_5678/m.7609 type:complete len:210 (+) Transcript_5678:63-692(+)
MGNEQGKQKKFQKQMDELNEAAFQMKWQARSLEKEASKAMANREVQMKKAKIEMDKGRMDIAQIIASEAIRYQKEAVGLNRMAGKMSAVGAKLESAARTQQVSMQIKNAVPGLKNCLKQMEKSGVAKNMASMEQVFEDLDVKTDGITSALDAIGGPTSEDNQAINELLQQMQSEQAMNQGVSIGAVNANQIQNPNANQVTAPAQQDDVA